MDMAARGKQESFGGEEGEAAAVEHQQDIARRVQGHAGGQQDGLAALVLRQERQQGGRGQRGDQQGLDPGVERLHAQGDGDNFDERQRDEEDAGDGITVNPAECRFLPFGHLDDPHQHADIQQDDSQGTLETSFLAYRTENEVGVLFGHEVILGLGALQEALSPETA